MNYFGLVFVAFGLLTACGALFNWDWYMNSRKAKFVSAIITRTGARIFYGVLGIALVVFGALATFNVVNL